jgi:hypothetical protein
MEAISLVFRPRRICEQRSKGFHRWAGIMDFGWYANWGGNESRKAGAYDVGIHRLSFAALINPDRSIVAKVARAPVGAVTTAVLIAATAITLLIRPLLIGFFLVALVISILKRPLRARATFGLVETLSFRIVVIGAVGAGLGLAGLRLRLEIGLRRRHKALDGRRESIGDAAEITVVLGFFDKGFAGLALISALTLLLGLLSRSDQPKIMFGVLEITLCHDRIAGRLRVTCQLQIFLADVVGGSTNLHIGAARFIGPRKRVWSLSAAAVVGAATHTLFILSWSHRCSLGGIVVTTLRHRRIGARFTVLAEPIFSKNEGAS